VSSQPAEGARPAALGTRRRERDDEYYEKPNRTRKDGNLVSAVIPYKNGLALGAYYCGVFSLIPGAALLLGPIALILGILGFGYVRAHPEAKGTGHAIAGIVLGSLTTVGNLLLVLIAGLMAMGYNVPLPNLSPNPSGPAPAVDPERYQKAPAPDYLFEGRKTYLSDLQEFNVWPRDRSLGKNGDVGNATHDRIIVNGQPSPKGLGMFHGQSGSGDAAYRLNGDYRSFRATVAVHESFPDNRTISTFEVYGDDQLLWRSRNIRNNGDTDECRIGVTGVKVLRIRTHGSGLLRDVHTLWVEPCLYSAK
jgi:hypothetical protein